MGSVQIFFLFFIGTFSGRATDAGWFKLSFLCGMIIQLVGLFTTSVATKYYQVFLAQGVAVGIGNGLMFCPSLSVVAPYFSKHRGFAIAVTATGSATGGLVYPAMVSRLLPQVGFPWTMRIVSFLTLALTFPPFFFSVLDYLHEDLVHCLICRHLKNHRMSCLQWECFSTFGGSM